jgi:hypothetical protein
MIVNGGFSIATFDSKGIAVLLCKMMLTNDGTFV